MGFLLQTGTALHTTDDSFAFALRGSDLVAIKKRNTGTNSTEIHILSASSGYQQFSLQTGTALHETDGTWDFAMRGNDLVAIKKSGTGTNSTEVHILDGGNGYQSFKLQTGTALHETDDSFAFEMRGSDLVAIKKRNTGTNSTEVHILDGGNGYQSFKLQTGTALHETDGRFAFAMRGNDLVAVKKSLAGTCSTEVHVLSASSGYKQFSLQTGTVLHETDDTFAFEMRGNDLFAIKKSSTGTNTTEVHILGTAGYATVPNPAFTQQTGTALHPTDDAFAFGMSGKDLVAIKKRNTGTSSTEVHILDGAAGYQSFKVHTGTPLHETDGTWAFCMRGDDVVGIKKSGTGTSSTEMHILSGASGYQQFILQTGTALHETDGTWAFCMRGDDLVGIKKSGTGTNSTEVHILSASSNYQQFSLQTGTALHETDGTWAFCMHGKDLVGIKKSATGTQTTELHVLSGASNYQQFNLQTDTPLHETDATWDFVVRGDEVVGLKKASTGTNSTEVHAFEIREHRFGLKREEVSYSMSECIYGWTAAYLLHGTHVIVRIQLNWDAGITAQQQTTLMTTWRNGIINEWSNRFACCFDPCCTRKRAVTFDVQWTNNNPHHQIRVRVGPGQTNSGLWDTADTGAVAAHEFGHLLGHPDEYSSATCPSRNPVNTGTVMDDNAGMVQRLIEPFCKRHNLRTTTP